MDRKLVFAGKEYILSGMVVFSTNVTGRDSSKILLRRCICIIL